MLGSLFQRDESRAIGQATVWGNWGDEYASTWSGTPVDSKNAMQLLSVYGCVRFIADGISTLPLDVYREESTTTPDGLQSTRRVEVSLPAWLDEPVVGLHRVAWLTQVLSSLLLDGNAYLAITRNQANSIVELVPLDAMKVEVKREHGKRVVYIDGHPAQIDVLHIPGLMLAGKEVGCSPVEYARQTIGAGMSAAEFGARFWSQGGTYGGVIEDPGPLDPTKARDMARGWAKLHSGKEKAHLPGVLQGGASWKPTSVTPEQSQFLQTRGFTDAQIAGQMFLVDPAELGIVQQGSSSSLTYQNLEQRNIRKVQVTFLPWIIRVETALSSLLARPRFVKFNVDALYRADIDSRFKAYAVGIQNRFLVPNEARRLEDYEPLPGGDVVADIPPAPKV